jgi:hypothetical protein
VLPSRALNASTAGSAIPSFRIETLPKTLGINGN